MPQLDRYAAPARIRFERRIADGLGRLQLAGTAEGEWRQCGLPNIDDDFRAAGSYSQPASRDPLLPFAALNVTPEGCIPKDVAGENRIAMRSSEPIAPFTKAIDAS
jgi:hypothetical protein